MDQVQSIFETAVRAAILLIELAGILVIVLSMARGLAGFLMRKEDTRIDLARGIMLGLEFKIGSEVLRSVIVSGWNELGTLAAVILLRSLLTLLLHWEINVEENRQAAKQRLACETARCPADGKTPVQPEEKTGR
ncbi:MAG: DUF1622 domain-containing protein [Clostridiales bacterium]|nr:DUF1622 domain-containing protein [Clostridiales bacterium]